VNVRDGENMASVLMAVTQFKGYILRRTQTSKVMPSKVGLSSVKCDGLANGGLFLLPCNCVSCHWWV